MVAGVVSLFAAVISGASTFLTYPQRAEKLLSAGHKYGELRRQIDALLLSRKIESEAEPGKILDPIRAEWDTLDEESPNVDQRFIEEAGKIVLHKYAKKEGKSGGSSGRDTPTLSK